VPSYFDINVKVFQVKTDDSETPYNDNVFDSKSNTLILDTFSPNQKGVHAIIDLKGILFNKSNDRDNAHGYYLTMDTDSILLEGGVNLLARYAQTNKSRASKIAASQALAIACNTQVGEITIDGGEGNFRQSIDLQEGMGSFTVKGLPDFLNDEEVKLRIKRPRIILKVGSDVGLDGKVTEPKLIATMKDGSKKEVTIEDFAINRHNKISGEESTITTIVVTNKDEKNTELGTDYDYNPSVTSETGLTDLMADISNIDNISMVCKTETNEELPGTVELGHEYTIRPEFQFYAPLELEPGSVIIYRDTISGWHDELEDLRLTSGSKIEVTANITNHLPMDLEFFVEPLELTQNGTLQKMSSSWMDAMVWTGEDTSRNTIPAGTPDNQTTTTLNISLNQTNGEALAHLDGLMIGVRGKAPEDKPSQLVKETCSLKLDNINIYLKGKLITGAKD
jgi:hypothetical protein